MHFKLFLAFLKINFQTSTSANNHIGGIVNWNVNVIIRYSLTKFLKKLTTENAFKTFQIVNVRCVLWQL
jgi:hypothetical protein